MHPDRNGYMYVLDRASGEVLSASPFVHITSSKGVDLKTGSSSRSKTRKPDTEWSFAISARPRRGRRTGSRFILAEDGLAVHAAQQPVHGLPKGRR